MARFIIFILNLNLSVLTFSQQEYPLETILQKGHSKYVTAADFHPSGKYVATGGYDNAVFLWNLENGKVIRQFNRHTSAVWAVEFNKEGTELLTASADNTARVFDLISGEQLHEITIPELDVREAFYSLNGEHIILLSNSNQFFVYDAESADLVGEFEKSYSVSRLENVIHPEGTKVLHTSGYKGAEVFDLRTGDTLLSIPFDKVFGMGFSPDGKYIALSSSKQFAKIMDAESGKEIAHLKDPDLESECDGCNLHMAWSNNSKYLLTMSNKSDALLWDVSKGKKIRSYCDIRERPTVLRFSKDDEYVIISLNEEVLVYETKSGKNVLRMKSEYVDYYNIHLSRDSRYITLPGDEQTAVVWDIRRGKRTKVLEGFLNQKKFDGMGFEYDNWYDKGILKFVSRSRGFSLSPDGSRIAFGNIDSVALLVDLSSGSVVHTLKGHSKAVLTTAFSPDGKLLATAGGDRLIQFWDVASGQLIKTLKGHRGMIFDIAFNSDGSKLISGSWDGSMILWDLKKDRYKSVDLGGLSPYRVGFTPNDLYIVSSNTKDQFEFWEEDALLRFRNLVGNTDIVSSFDFSPDGSKVATASWDGKVKVWDVLTGMQTARFNGHSGAAFSVFWDPKNRFIASAGADHNIYLFDAANGKLIRQLQGHNTAVTHIEINQMGTQLISCSEEGMIKVWDLQHFTEIYSRIQISRSEWLTTTKTGYFDGSPKALDLVNYVSGMEVIPVNSLFDKYFTPKLIQRINAGESFNDTGERFNEVIGNTPLVAIHLSESGKRSVKVREDSVYNWKRAEISLDLEIDSKDKAVDEIRVYNNGKLIMAESLNKELVFRGGDKDKRTIMVPLNDGINEIKALVINKERTESSPTKIVVEFDGEAAKTDLFILSIGINKYKNPDYDLDYAVNDAKSFAKAIKKGGDTLFNQIHVFSVENDEATKPIIAAKLEEIKKAIGPEDVFLFYYAGHGVMSFASEGEEAEFFIVTHDVVNLYTELAVLKEKALSAAELMQYSAGISAEKQLFILDACHSGGALNSFSTRGGGSREKAMAQLARSTGTFFLTASQDAQYANEVGNLKHGLFTYALLEVLEQTVGDNGDKKITVSEMKSYVEDRVPELSQEHRGSPQYPTSYSFGQDFPLVIIK